MPALSTYKLLIHFFGFLATSWATIMHDHHENVTSFMLIVAHSFLIVEKLGSVTPDLSVIMHMCVYCRQLRMYFFALLDTRFNSVTNCFRHGNLPKDGVLLVCFHNSGVQCYVMCSVV